VSAEPTSQPLPLRPLARERGIELRIASSRTAGHGVGARVSRHLRIALPIINFVSATLTYIFIVFVVPLPGRAAPAAARVTALIAAVGMFIACWIICELWGTAAYGPVQTWLDEQRQPTAAERARAIRLPLGEALRVFLVWSGGAVGFGVLDYAFGGSPAGGVLVTVMVGLGGCVAAGLSYLATERITRPVTALALAWDPPTRRLMPGIGARLYLAWEFGTAVAVGGAVVVAIAYLCGADVSPRRMAATVIFLGLLALTVGLATLLIAIRSVTDPIRSMRAAMRRVEAGETELGVAVDDGSEIGLLQAGFNQMLKGLRERDRVRDLFGRHVGEEVARSALGRELELGGELREAAVLFVDVVASTAFAATRDPQSVVETLNRFFCIVLEAVTAHGGWINKFEGDAALCVFGAPAEHPDAAGAALGAARELAARLETELDDIEAAIGVSAGPVVAGNVGAAERYEYTVIGDPVNEAARLSELAKSRPSRLLASDGILNRVRSAEAERWRVCEQVTLRGRSAPTSVAIPV
jgi:adenylate cyclase